ncbi:hypothetical protein KUCAC02_030745, partial [Chaenocephalus aceratus]
VVKAIEQELALVLRQPHVLQPLSDRLVQALPQAPSAERGKRFSREKPFRRVAAALRGRHMALPHHPRPAEAEPSAAAPGGVGETGSGPGVRGSRVLPSIHTLQQTAGCAAPPVSVLLISQSSKSRFRSSRRQPTWFFSSLGTASSSGQRFAASPACLRHAGTAAAPGSHTLPSLLTGHNVLTPATSTQETADLPQPQPLLPRPFPPPFPHCVIALQGCRMLPDEVGCRST